jgi:hypothetical protein
MINREKNFQMFNKQVMKTVTGEDVEVAVPIGEFNIQELEQQIGMYYNDKTRADERIGFIQNQIDMIIKEQTKNPEPEVKEVEAELVAEPFKEGMVINN